MKLCGHEGEEKIEPDLMSMVKKKKNNNNDDKMNAAKKYKNHARVYKRSTTSGISCKTITSDIRCFSCIFTDSCGW